MDQGKEVGCPCFRVGGVCLLRAVDRTHLHFAVEQHSVPEGKKGKEEEEEEEEEKEEEDVS